MTMKEFLNMDLNSSKRNELLGLVEVTSKTKGISKNLLDRCEYTLKHKVQSKRVDLIDLLEDAKEEFKAALAKSSKSKAPAPAEASTKKLPKKGKKAPVESATTDAEPEEKPEGKKTKKSDKVVSSQMDNKTKFLPGARMFPDELTITDANDEEIKLESRHNEFKNIDEVRAAIESGRNLYFAAYWTKRQIRQYNYASYHCVEAPKDGFPDDLDILEVVIVCDKVARLYAMSAYTEAMYNFEGEDIPPVEDEDANGKFSVRVSNGMEYEIYEAK